MKIIRPILIGLLVLGLAAGGYYAYTYYQATSANQAVTYQTVQIVKGNLNAVVGATGTVHANQTSTLVWQISGSVLSVAVAVGDQVDQGNTLALLDRTTLPQAMILAEADLVTAQRNLDNLRHSNLANAQAF